MKQLSKFLISLILINLLAHILTSDSISKEPQYESPWIIKPENIRKGSKVTVSANKATMVSISPIKNPL